MNLSMNIFLVTTCNTPAVDTLSLLAGDEKLPFYSVHFQMVEELVHEVSEIFLFCVAERDRDTQSDSCVCVCVHLH